MNPYEWIQYEVLGNSVLLWLVGAGAFVLALIVLFLGRRLLLRRLHKLGEQTAVDALEIVEHSILSTKAWFLALLAAYIGSRFWTLPESGDAAMTRIAMVAFLFQAGLWISAAILKYIELKREQELEENPGAVAAMDILTFVIRVAIWSVVLLAILDNLGINITTLVAGLGVGGIAVALAAQNILGDLFASLSIVLDKPFVVGDFLILDDYLGSVEKVGIKTTRIRSLSGEQLVFSNNDLLSSRIRNYGRMFERRVLFSLGVTYQTPAEKLKRIPGIIREAVEAQDHIRFDRAHFQKYGDFALIFEVVYYVLSADYNHYMDIQQAINLQIFEEFEQAGIEFAYPTQTLYLNQETG